MILRMRERGGLRNIGHRTMASVTTYKSCSVSHFKLIRWIEIWSTSELMGFNQSHLSNKNNIYMTMKATLNSNVIYV